VTGRFVKSGGFDNAFARKVGLDETPDGSGRSYSSEIGVLRSAMLNWIISVIHDPNSPLWFSRDIFRSVVQSLLGAIASALLIAPLTARWVAWETTRKWRPARRVAFRDIEHGTSLICNSFGDWSIVARNSESENDLLLSCWSIYTAMSEGHEELKKAYADWSDLWSPQQASAIIGLLEYVSDLCHNAENESNLISRIVDFDEQPDQLKKGDRWRMVTPQWVESGEVPRLDVGAMRSRFNRLRASCSDRALVKIFDDCSEALSGCDQKAMDALQRTCRETMLKKARIIELAFAQKT
jgi:hypothetical protein